MWGYKWLKTAPEGISCDIYATPKSAKNAMEGEWVDADGKIYLKVRITAAPEDGKANKAIIKYLAKEWGIPASQMEIIRGDTSRRKTLAAYGNPPELLHFIRTYFDKKISKL